MNILCIISRNISLEKSNMLNNALTDDINTSCYTICQTFKNSVLLRFISC